MFSDEGSYATNDATWEVHYEIHTQGRSGGRVDVPWPAEIVVEQWATNARTERCLVATRIYAPAGDPVSGSPTIALPELQSALEAAVREAERGSAGVGERR